VSFKKSKYHCKNVSFKNSQYHLAVRQGLDFLIECYSLKKKMEGKIVIKKKSCQKCRLKSTKSLVRATGSHQLLLNFTKGFVDGDFKKKSIFIFIFTFISILIFVFWFKSLFSLILPYTCFLHPSSSPVRCSVCVAVCVAVCVLQCVCCSVRVAVSALQ